MKKLICLVLSVITFGSFTHYDSGFIDKDKIPQVDLNDSSNEGKLYIAYGTGFPSLANFEIGGIGHFDNNDRAGLRWDVNVGLTHIGAAYIVSAKTSFNYLSFVDVTKEKQIYYGIGPGISGHVFNICFGFMGPPSWGDRVKGISVFPELVIGKREKGKVTQLQISFPNFVYHSEDSGIHIVPVPQITLNRSF